MKARLYTLRKNAGLGRVLKGHDFSRAVSAFSRSLLEFRGEFERRFEFQAACFWQKEADQRGSREGDSAGAEGPGKAAAHAQCADDGGSECAQTAGDVVRDSESGGARLRGKKLRADDGGSGEEAGAEEGRDAGVDEDQRGLARRGEQRNGDCRGDQIERKATRRPKRSAKMPKRR